MKLVNPARPEDPSLAQQVFDLCSAAAESAGGYLVPHPAEHSINVVFAGHQVTITVASRDKM
jgi:hypothetical protein